MRKPQHTYRKGNKFWSKYFRPEKAATPTYTLCRADLLSFLKCQRPSLVWHYAIVGGKQLRWTATDGTAYYTVRPEGKSKTNATSSSEDWLIPTPRSLTHSTAGKPTIHTTPCAADHQTSSGSAKSRNLTIKCTDLKLEHIFNTSDVRTEKSIQQFQWTENTKKRTNSSLCNTKKRCYMYHRNAHVIEST